MSIILCVRDQGYLDTFVMYSLLSESVHLDKSGKEAFVRVNCKLLGETSLLGILMSSACSTELLR